MHYFDNAATTFPKPSEVYDEINNFYRNFGVNVGRGMYKEASIANKMVEETRELVRNLFHVNKTYDVVFTPSATIALNQVLRGLHLNDSSVIYISPFEHNAVMRTLHDMQKTIKFEIRTLAFDSKNFEYDIDRIYEEFKKTPPTSIVISHASNVFGNIAPIRSIFNAGKKYNSINIGDFAQTAGLLDIDLINDYVDYAIFAGHKTLYGPLGVGGIISVKMSDLIPLITGGTGIDSQNLDMPKIVPEAYEAGSLNTMSIAGLNASLKWIRSVGINKIRETEKNITLKLLKILFKYRNIYVFRNKDEEQNIGVVSCLFENYTSEEIGQIMSNYDIAVRTGLHCAPLGHKMMHTFPQGTVRFSVSYFTSDEDINALEKVLSIISQG